VLLCLSLSPDDQKELVFDTVKEWLSSPDLAKDVTLQLMAAQIYLANGRLKESQTNTQRRQHTGGSERAAATENCVATWSSPSLPTCMPPHFCSTALSLVVNDAENLEKYAPHDPPACTHAEGSVSARVEGWRGRSIASASLHSDSLCARALSLPPLLSSPGCRCAC